MTPAFLENLQAIQAQIDTVISTGTQEEYFSTLTLVFDANIHIAVMLGTPSAKRDILMAIEAFSYKHGRKRKVPEFAFFAAESIDSAGGEQIMVSGCSSELEVIIAYLTISRDAAGMIKSGHWGSSASVAKTEIDHVPAFRALRGAQAKASAPWWKP